MPEIRRYTVTREQKVRVAANSVVDAVLIAEAAFENGQSSDNSILEGSPGGVWGHPITKVKSTSIYASED